MSAIVDLAFEFKREGNVSRRCIAEVILYLRSNTTINAAFEKLGDEEARFLMEYGAENVFTALVDSKEIDFVDWSI